MEYTDWTGKIEVPTLVIFGMKDNALLPCVLDGLENYIFNLAIVKLEASGHSPQKDQPELTSNHLKSFLH